MNLYIHFPFCATKCTYCALHSRAGSRLATREAYVQRLVRELSARAFCTPFQTIYLGGGSPARAPLKPLLEVLAPLRNAETEFTVELHPLQVTTDLLHLLKNQGVTRISMGIQNFDPAILEAMGRAYSPEQAEKAFRLIQTFFPNSGFDLIAGWPTQSAASWRETLIRACALQSAHISCYALIREKATRLDGLITHHQLPAPSDEQTLDRILEAHEIFQAHGFVRYELANWAKPGFACRHNQAVWRGEDYVGLGEGAFGREGLFRTEGTAQGYARTFVSEQEDALERVLFSLRTQEGLNLPRLAIRFPILVPYLPRWHQVLTDFVREGLVTEIDVQHFCLTLRGYEVCDAILAELET